MDSAFLFGPDCWTALGPAGLESGDHPCSLTLSGDLTDI